MSQQNQVIPAQAVTIDRDGEFQRRAASVADATVGSDGHGRGLPLVSVVIPTHRRPELLRRCLTALIRQEYPPDRWEIVVVEDGEPSGAAEVVAELRARETGVEVQYARIDQSGPAAARNAGWRRARGEIIAFTDDDTLPAPGWIAASVRSFAQGADAVSGRTVVPLPPRPTDAQRNVKRLESAPFVTCNAFCRRDLLAALGGFDARFARAYREDSDLQFTLLEAGARVVRNDDAVVVHPPRSEQRLVSLRQQRNQFFDALLYRKHPARFRQFIRARPPWRHYAITVGQVVSVLTGLLGWRRATLAVTTGWVALVAVFCIERLSGGRNGVAQVAEMAVTSLVIPPVAVFWRLRGAWAFKVWFL